MIKMIKKKVAKKVSSKKVTPKKVEKPIEVEAKEIVEEIILPAIKKIDFEDWFFEEYIPYVNLKAIHHPQAHGKIGSAPTCPRCTTAELSPQMIYAKL